MIAEHEFNEDLQKFIKQGDMTGACNSGEAIAAYTLGWQDAVKRFYQMQND